MKPGGYIKKYLLYWGEFPSCLNKLYVDGSGKGVLTHLREGEVMRKVALIISLGFMLLGFLTSILCWEVEAYKAGSQDLTPLYVCLFTGVALAGISFWWPAPRTVVNFEKDLKEVLAALREWTPEREIYYMSPDEARHWATECLIRHAHTVLKMEREHGKGSGLSENWRFRLKTSFNLFKKYKLIGDAEDYKYYYERAQMRLENELQEASKK